jgi:deoxyribonuclease-4
MIRLAPVDGRRFGAHMMTQGGLQNAFHAGREYGCEVIQLFTSSPQQWKARAVTGEVTALFVAAGRECGVPCVAAHANYLLNPASPDEAILAKSRQGLLEEVERCAALGIPAVVMHLGGAMGAPEAEALERLAESLRQVLAAADPAGPCLLLETTAGQGTALGYTFEQLAMVLEGVDGSPRVGVCLDTCHVFAAGYDLRSAETYAAVMARFHELIGLDRLALIHANDSKRELGSRVDRHEHIGQGHLGEAAFGHLLTDPRLREVPVVLETPKKDEMDRVNLASLRRLAAAAN